MRKVHGLILVWFLFASAPLCASDAEEVELDKLPQNSVERIQKFVSEQHAQLLNVWKETDGNKECYIIRIERYGRTLDYYISPRGSIILKENGFAAEKLPKYLLEFGLIFILPGIIGGTFSRIVFLYMGYERLSIGLEWISAWIGAMCACAVLPALSNSRDKDWLIIVLVCAAAGISAASIIEMIGLTIQSARKYRIGNRRYIIGFFVVACTFYFLTIPVIFWGNMRHNQHTRDHVMRIPGQ